ncbi:hypothetical protein OHC33_000144 [Knufia fluminis]|uniref:Helicase C-terminal domain-containing protein n=1 Tax=Knufia fluminis TaxID=191047 RepID=A0AAN8ETB0_9EURO|nr:hypothetical protein OHC33_000144 [Knufia fluminis]
MSYQVTRRKPRQPEDSTSGLLPGWVSPEFTGQSTKFLDDSHELESGFDEIDFYVGPSNMDSQPDANLDTFTASDYSSSELITPPEHTLAQHGPGNVLAFARHLDDLMLQSPDGIDFGDRLKEKMPYDDGSIAFGTIRLYDHKDEASGTTVTYMRGHVSDEVYPNMLIKNARSKKTIRLDGLSIGTRQGVTSLRVYILPEDVDRSSRGHVRDFHKLVRYLLNFVDCSTEAWTGQADPQGPVHIYREPVYDMEESVFYTFNTLCSPKPDPSAYVGPSHGLHAMTDALDDKITGLKTKMYPYQKRSVAAMISKESSPAKIKDPRKTKMLDIYGNLFYLDLNDGSLFRQLPHYSEPQGGILAETMGYGKTLICLALILATRGHYPSIPHYCIETRPEETYSETPSLLSMAARHLKHAGLPWKNEFYMLKKSGYYHDRCIGELQKYTRAYEEPTAGYMNPSRRGKPEYSNIIRLCSATLIIVPPNLIIQWQQEIKQHIDEDAIDVFVIDGPSIMVPPWQDLVKYDVILISKSRFEQEYRDDDLHQGKGTRYAEKYKSPLTEVRWLRVICDEGHGFAGSATKTNAMAMLDKMFIERRWVVSGTPSSNLHGVEVGLASAESNLNAQSTASPDAFGSALKQRRAPSTQDSEAKDLERLRLIVVNFLKLQPWANKKGEDMADWKTYLAPRTNEHAKRYSMPALREVMQTLIVRHRIQDVECDLTLPSLHNKVVYLEPSYHDKLAINQFIMVLVSNYVTSEREDEDYMFHPRNRGKLTTLINNLGHATFYWVGFTEQNVRDTLDVSDNYLSKSIDKVSDNDGLLLTEALQNGERALSDAAWRAFSTMHEMGVYVGKFPEQAKASWALDGISGEPLLLGTTQAREVQKHVQSRVAKQPSNPTRDLARHGTNIMNAVRNKAEEDLRQRQKQKLGTEQKDVGTTESPAKRAPTNISTPSKSAVRTNVSEPSESRDGEHPIISTVKLPESEVLGFASSKLTYLCDKLMSHPDEKAIIFYNNNNTAFFTAEALELLRIPFLIYANTLSVQKRAEYLAKFNADTETRVLLMDLKQAGQGLHVAAASRVYILNPIWDQAIESQAIKRAHRIGQNREVYVETLVLKDTFEEALVKRRKEKVEQEQNGGQDEGADAVGNQTQPAISTLKKIKGAPSNPMLDDSVMVKVLKEIQFLKITDEEERFVRLSHPVPLFVAPAVAGTSRTQNAPSGDTGPSRSMPETSNAALTANKSTQIRPPIRFSIFGSQEMTASDEASSSKRTSQAASDKPEEDLSDVWQPSKRAKIGGETAPAP